MAIVTISRGTYTGGIAVAEGLAAALGHPCVSREIVVDAARDSGVPEAELQSTLEEPPHFWEKTPGKIAASLNLVRAALLKRSRGRRPRLPRLRRPPAAERHRARVARADHRRSGVPHQAGDEEEEGIDHRAAADSVKRVDNQLVKWTRFLYGVEWQDPLLYDVVLNLEHMSIESAVKTIVEVTRRDDFEPTADSRKAFDDLLLSSNVWAALTADRRTRSANVRVAADDGVVFVTGLADNDRTLTAVQEVAATVDGVARWRARSASAVPGNGDGMRGDCGARPAGTRRWALIPRPIRGDAVLGGRQDDLTEVDVRARAHVDHRVRVAGVRDGDAVGAVAGEALELELAEDVGCRLPRARRRPRARP